jgi:hypothetical protein
MFNLKTPNDFLNKDFVNLKICFRSCLVFCKMDNSVQCESIFHKSTRTRNKCSAKFWKATEKERKKERERATERE